jgi:hypothetical protein
MPLRNASSERVSGGEERPIESSGQRHRWEHDIANLFAIVGPVARRGERD